METSNGDVAKRALSKFIKELEIEKRGQLFIKELHNFLKRVEDPKYLKDLINKSDKFYRAHQADYLNGLTHQKLSESIQHALTTATEFLVWFKSLNETSDISVVSKVRHEARKVEEAFEPFVYLMENDDIFEYALGVDLGYKNAFTLIHIEASSVVEKAVKKDEPKPQVNTSGKRWNTI